MSFSFSTAPESDRAGSVGSSCLNGTGESPQAFFYVQPGKSSPHGHRPPGRVEHGPLGAARPQQVRRAASMRKWLLGMVFGLVWLTASAGSHSAQAEDTSIGRFSYYPY